MKTLKTLILIILIAAIGICGYLCYQEYFQKETPVAQDYEPSVTMLNDSTYHINLTESTCCTLTRRHDTLYVESTGANITRATSDSTLIIVAVFESFILDYTDFYGDIKFDSVNITLR